MSQEYRYTLTRICLRSGELTLPLRMVDLFPDEGVLRAVDTNDGSEFEIYAQGRRTVGGLGEFFDRHRLDVNDTVVIRPLEEGRFAFTPVPRARKPDYDDPESVAAMLDELLEGGPVTEAEIRALHPELPEGFDLAGLLRADPRFRFQGGRWQPEPGTTAAAGGRPDPEERAPNGPPFGGGEPADRREASAAGAQDEDDLADRLAPSSGGTEGQPGEPEPPFDGSWGSGAELYGEPEEERLSPDAAAVGSHGTHPAESDGDTRRPGRHPGGRGSESEVEPEAVPDISVEGEGAGYLEEGEGARSGGVGSTEDRSENDAERYYSPDDRSMVRSQPVGSVGPDEAALNSTLETPDLSLVNRARGALQRFGYRVDGLPHGLLMARADLGRKQHSVLVKVLPEGGRIDWAALMARRRDGSASYLAVFGDHRDLHRQTAPAELARATLWSWDGIARVEEITRTVLVSPVDLEPHFQRDGMFDHGLDRFERAIARRIAERGAFSSVLTRLAALRAPSVFVLDDIVDEDVSREQALRVLELLAYAPFQLVSRVDNGEYCLRSHVGEGLQHLANYATSLRDHLPRNRRERLSGLPDGDGTAEQ